MKTKNMYDRFQRISEEYRYYSIAIIQFDQYVSKALIQYKYVILPV